MESIIVLRTGERPLKFCGEEVARGETSIEQVSSSYSGAAGRAEEVRVYRTARGKYVVAIHHRTCWQGEHDSHEAAVVASTGEAVSYLGDRIPGWLLERIVKDIGIEAVAEEIEGEEEES